MPRDPSRCPTHPGEVLREDILPAVRATKSVIAEGLGMSRQHLHNILRGSKPVTPDMAVRLGAMFGGDPLMWVRMQGAYDAWHAAREVDVSGIPRLKAAA